MEDDFIIPENPENPFDSIDLFLFKEEVIEKLEEIFSKVKE